MPSEKRKVDDVFDAVKKIMFEKIARIPSNVLVAMEKDMTVEIVRRRRRKMRKRSALNAVVKVILPTNVRIERRKKAQGSPPTAFASRRLYLKRRILLVQE